MEEIRFRRAAVRALLSQLDTSKAHGADNLSARVLRECAAELSGPVARLFSTFFRAGFMPAAWKMANVVPVYKKKNRSSVTNYRPISLLPILSKVMESVINTQLMNFLEEHGILSRNQFGFRPKLGTTDLLAALQHEWVSTLNAGGCVRLLAVDIAGAFDKVSHRCLLHKAAAYGVRGPLLLWLRAYLDGRTLRAVVGGTASPEHSISAGVPQGSVLGPTLFLLYVNDLEDYLPPSVRLAVYADDTTLYANVASAATVAATCSLFQDATDALSLWGRHWYITFEPSKSHALTLGTRRWDFPPLLFDGVVVPEVEEIELLGVIVDQKLTFAPQISKLCTKARQRLGFLRRASRVLCGRRRANTYKAFVRPRLEYAHLCWMGAADSHLAKLDDVQNAAIRLLGPDAPPLDSLDHRRRVGALTYLYKLQCWDCPSRLQDLVPPPLPYPEGRTRAQRDAQITWHSKQFADPLPLFSSARAVRSFPNGLIDEWNSLPAEYFTRAYDLKSLQSFKEAVHRELSYRLA